MLVLALDSANRTASAALWRTAQGHGNERIAASGVLLGCGALNTDEYKADHLVSVVSRLLEDHRLSYQHLDLLAVNRGPGSFTGVRSAVALARGLALAAALPVLGVTSMAAIAASIPADDDGGRSLMVVQDARRNEVYAQPFDGGRRPIDEVRSLPPEEVADIVATGSWRLAGSGGSLVRAHLDDRDDIAMVAGATLDAAAVARAAVRRLAAGEAPTTGFALHPLYIRPPDARPPAPLVAVAMPGGTAAGRLAGADG